MKQKVSFADILEKWEQNPANHFVDKDAALSAEKNSRDDITERRSRLLRKKPDAVIDLHGLNSDEAWEALWNFFEDARKKGLEKVLIIHGKGIHRANGLSARANVSSAEAVLRNLSRRFIESCSYAGESGFSHSKEGGKGSTWVVLKRN
jgi:DNA-nicking Smr family endonuclease